MNDNALAKKFYLLQKHKTIIGLDPVSLDFTQALNSFKAQGFNIIADQIPAESPDLAVNKYQSFRTGNLVFCVVMLVILAINLYMSMHYVTNNVGDVLVIAGLFGYFLLQNSARSWISPELKLALKQAKNHRTSAQ